MPWALALWSLILLRRYDLAAQITTWIEDLQKKTPPDDTRTLAWIHFGLHFGRLHLGDPERVWRDAQLSVKYFFEFGDRLNGGAALSCSARAALNIGYIDEADEAVRRAIELNESLNLGVLAAASKRFLAYVLFRKGDVDQALALVEEAIVVLATEKSDALIGLWRTDAAIHASLCAFHDRAEQLVVPSLEALRSAPPTRALALMVLARAHVHKSHPAEALSLMREADALIEQVGGRIGDHDLFVRLVRAETLHANNLSDEAWTTIDDACARVMTVAERIRDENMRQSFVERVPENLQILALAERIAASR
jgi:tetratricopeptide (TPR) repeat protein